MEIAIPNAEFVWGRVLHYLEIGKEELREVGPEVGGKTTGFVPQVTFINPPLPEVDLPVKWTNLQEKHLQTWAASETARETGAAAIIFRSCFSLLDTTRVAKEISLKVPTGTIQQRVDYFEKKVLDWAEKLTGKRSIGNLPDEFRIDALVVLGFGPGLPHVVARQTYKWQAEQLVFGKQEILSSAEVVIQVIPPWWD